MIDPTTLEQWQAVCDAATAGPWHCAMPACDCEEAIANEESSVEDDHTGCCVVDHATEIDANFIALARTALPQAIAEIRRLRAALRKYGEHQEDCTADQIEDEHDNFVTNPCTCGFSEAVGTP